MRSSNEIIIPTRHRSEAWNKVCHSWRLFVPPVAPQCCESFDGYQGS